MSTHVKKKSAEKLLKGCEGSAASESKKSFISLHDNASDFSSVKVPRERHNATLEDINGPLEKIEQADYEATPVKGSAGQSRFKEKSPHSS